MGGEEAQEKAGSFCNMCKFKKGGLCSGDDEREAKRRKTAKTVEVVGLITEEPQAVVRRQSSQTARGVKRQASFHTPSPKKRLFSPDSKGRDSQSPGSQSPGSQSPSSQSPDSNPVQKRKIEQLKKTLGQGSPVYYRLDYLWGKAAEAEAKPGLSPDTASDRQKQQQAENLQNLQQKASQAVEKLGLEPAVGVLRKRKGGRPLGSKQKTKRAARRFFAVLNGPSHLSFCIARDSGHRCAPTRPGSYSRSWWCRFLLALLALPVPVAAGPPGLLTTALSLGLPDARAKLSMMEVLDRAAVEQKSRRAARQHVMRLYGVSESFCWNLEKDYHRQKVRNFLASTGRGQSARQAGSHLGLVHLVSKSTGRRLADPGKVLGRPDFLLPVWSETRAWALNEEASQHVLTSTDVLMDFEERLDKAIAVRQAEQESGLLDQTGQKELAAMVQKKTSLASKPKQRSKYQIQLLAKCGLRNRSCQQTANLSQEEEKARLESSWRLWDMLLEQAASPTPQPDLPVASPEQWAPQRAETAITMSDQVPAWLKPTPGKVLTSVVRLKLAREQSKIRCGSKVANQLGS
ncbi:unnamed protein product [Symbiodinium sp. CCMP2592]|nr:unnamed protein product [Symbiodinium sp. CCMP2592]